MLKKLLGLSLALAMIFSTGMIVSASDDHMDQVRSFDEAVPIEVQAAMAAQEDALDSYFNLIMGWR